MTDPRLNRCRDDHLSDARHKLRIWSEWTQAPQPNPWPRESSEVRASQSKQAQTRLNRRARWRGKGAPPPMPKETRPSGHSRIPPIDRARIGPMVDRLLKDMDQSGPTRSEQAQALRLHVRLGGSTSKVAEALLVDVRTVRRRVRKGLEYLAERLTWVPLERRRVEVTTLVRHVEEIQ